MCSTPKFSEEGSKACVACMGGYYLHPDATLALPSEQCVRCPAEATNCSYSNVSLTTLPLLPQRWRLSAASSTLYKCPANGQSGMTPCVGGTSAGVDGVGYCLPGHHGPMCQVCDVSNSSSMFFDSGAARCVECPDLRNALFELSIMVIVTVVAIGLLLLASARPPRWLGGVARLLHDARARVSGAALLPKAKILVGGFQIMCVCGGPCGACRARIQPETGAGSTSAGPQRRRRLCASRPRLVAHLRPPPSVPLLPAPATTPPVAAWRFRASTG